MDMWTRRGPKALHLLFFLLSNEESMAPLWQEWGYFRLVELSQRERCCSQVWAPQPFPALMPQDLATKDSELGEHLKGRTA